MVSAADTTSAIALMSQQPNLWSPSSKVNGWQIVCSKSFFSTGPLNYRYITETIF